MTRKFWTIWKNEYLMELRDRHKVIGKRTRSSDQHPCIGDVVLLDDDSPQPRGQWPMAVIIDLIRSRDGEIRSALLQNSTGRNVQRPINRLIPLEIQSSAQSSEDRIYEPSTIQERTTARRKTSFNLAKKDVAIRLQPPRAAKNQTSYNEARSGSKSFSNFSSTPLFMIAMCALSLFNSGSAATISCSSKGATINRTHLAKAELCINYRECKIIPEGDNVTEVALPFKYIVNQHTIQWRMIVDSKQYTETIVCPAGDVCQKISCIMCTEFFGNPHCAPRMAIGIFALCLAAILTPLSLLCYMTCQLTLFKRGWIRIRGILKQSKQQKKESLPMTKLSALPTSSKLIVFSVVMAHLLPNGQSCQYTHTLNANNTVCSRSSYQTDCREVQESTITLSENRPQACFRLRNGNQTIGSMEVQLHHVFLTCNPVVLFYTRDVNIITESVKRCDLAGSCTSRKCTHISSRTEIPELRDTYEYPGIARCTTSCGGLGCGCLLPMPGCLYSRSYAKPKNGKIYRVFHCPTWQESALITFTYTGTQGAKASDMITIGTQTTHVMKDANITLEFITMPAIPLLGTIFVGTVDLNHSEIAAIEEEDFLSLRCATMKSASNISECYVEDRCSCSSSETEAKCDCRNLNISSKMTSTESRLPLSSSVLHLQDNHGRVFGAVHSAVVDLTISTSAVYQADSMIDNENCEITASPLHGCYNCLQGAEVTFSCYSYRPITIEVECQKKIFSATCNSSTARTTAKIHGTVSRYKESCLVKCGSKAHNIIITGILAFHTHWRTPHGQPMIEHANYVNMFNYPDLGHLLDVAMEHWKSAVLAVIAVAVCVAVTVLTVPKLIARLLC
ncbi:hypothetical protein TELCIR_20203 [Teladorsagia circumcincta]|uniref:Phlebovirus glycoprotein G2 fusion domain-containing protein n=1 Tax=Teladorsagia circumcincta TaxID=45464 RepID=A0A2G9TK67_TELCI|nr:hypothetical protein TELCIR_20203 [Teladorsagia circumcincta]